MKKLMVVSDNPALTTFFQEEFARQCMASVAAVEYRYSAVNKAPQGMMALGASAADMKDPAFIEKTKESFDLIFSIHCKQIFPAELVQSVTCVNLHPGLNPHNRGWYPQVFSIINGKPVGATLHLMDEDIDHGAIIAQQPVNVGASDTSADVYNRVAEAEKLLLAANLRSLVQGNFKTSSTQEEGNYNSIGDFNALCALDMNSTGTLREHVDLLRALTHADYKNGYFFDSEGKRVFVRLSLEQEC